MKNPSIERPSIASPVIDAPVVDISGVVLSSPPNYTKGKQIIGFIFFEKQCSGSVSFWASRIPVR